MSVRALRGDNSRLLDAPVRPFNDRMPQFTEADILAAVCRKSLEDFRIARRES